MCKRRQTLKAGESYDATHHYEAIIAGGGLVPVFEREAALSPNVGAGLIVQQNGLKVIRDIDETLYQEILNSSSAFTERTWERHDGTVVASATESHSRGIQRWRLQHLLYQAERRKESGKDLTQVDCESSENEVTVHFTDGSRVTSGWLFAADGARSKVRQTVAPDVQWQYSGWTTFMGIFSVASSKLRMPSSLTTSATRYFLLRLNRSPVSKFISLCHRTSRWGTLTYKRCTEVCQKLATELKNDDWDESFLKHLNGASRSVQVGFGELKPALKKWVYGRVALLGDASHPPLPFPGKGSQQGFEDWID